MPVLSKMSRKSVRNFLADRGYVCNVVYYGGTPKQVESVFGEGGDTDDSNFVLARVPRIRPWKAFLVS